MKSHLFPLNNPRHRFPGLVPIYQWWSDNVRYHSTEKTVSRKQNNVNTSRFIYKWKRWDSDRRWEGHEKGPRLKARQCWIPLGACHAPDYILNAVFSVAQSCPTLCDPMDCSPPGSSVHGILQARKLEWVAVPSSQGSSWPSDQTQVAYVSCIGRHVLNQLSNLESTLNALHSFNHNRKDMK